MGPIERSLKTKIENEYRPEHLDLANESPDHGLDTSAEKHFRAVIVSRAFSGISRVQRHQMVYSLLAGELASAVHALSLHLYTPEEWLKCQGSTPESPACLGGSKRESKS